jgi:hypothetical protein
VVCMVNVVAAACVSRVGRFKQQQLDLKRHAAVDLKVVGETDELISRSTRTVGMCFVTRC